MMLTVLLGVKRVIITCFIFNIDERYTLTARKSTLSTKITAEVTRPTLHLPDESQCGCTTDQGRKSAPGGFSVKLYGVLQHHIQFKNAFV